LLAESPFRWGRATALKLLTQELAPWSLWARVPGDSMYGPDIFVRSNSVPTTGGPSGKPFKYGNAWQYHPRSDRHSKIARWAVMFDLLRECPLLRKHVADGKVAFGINHPMRDFAQNREKNLDFVILASQNSRRVFGTVA
jgi:hypothetical protein